MRMRAGRVAGSGLLTRRMVIVGDSEGIHLVVFPKDICYLNVAPGEHYNQIAFKYDTAVIKRTPEAYEDRISYFP